MQCLSADPGRFIESRDLLAIEDEQGARAIAALCLDAQSIGTH
jgi:hypothetical protein